MFVISVTAVNDVIASMQMILSVIGQEFSDPIECYLCKDKAYNTTCGEPTTEEELEEMDKVHCKKGACIKWTFYKNHELMMLRTCSEKIRINLLFDNVCHTERNGNGYLCLCPHNMCNTASSTHSPLIISIIIALLSSKLFYVL
ncbi:hypothetical protein CAPTEDRAFT_214596 [Capitella teleta]|uniref:UPAR/Ly6 domain-containing protein qvr n=1 Tax=Capitella teleta TaxID=283909 RepID=R7VC07_CAPTE|nr:hypothetical protein CAPTEDRAFT_214596 [Capitella teleta]|eukprot:ELU16097.1 hypothetical protein CAPTEDRAFT_214596 [Capitella teleta]